MKSRFTWVVVSCLMVLSLVLAACAPAVTEEEEVAAPPAKVEEEEEVTPTPEEVVGPGPEVPKYGGVFTYAIATPLMGFDDAFTYPWQTYTSYLTNEELGRGDWAKGPAGTGDAGWRILSTYGQELYTGALAESWEMTDSETLVYHIRQGVYWQNRPPVNGREFTADDVVYSLKRLWESQVAYMPYSFLPEDRPVSITAPDRQTVIIKVPEGTIGQHLIVNTDLALIVAREVIEAYGNMRAWENVVGTGAFELVDHVPGSSATLTRNPTYWGRDPLHPENQLPYLDGVKILTIPDASTRLAALRTGKVEYLAGLSRDDSLSLMETNAELEYVKYLYEQSEAIWLRTDDPESPLGDIRVRRALAMAIDNQGILDDVYGGQGELLSIWVMPTSEFMEMYTPLEEQSELVQELYGYDPEKAKQLLAEAGYPDGFETAIVAWQDQVSMISIVKSYWADIGVDLEIDVREYGIWTAIVYGYMAYDDMVYGPVTSNGMPYKQLFWLLTGAYPHVSDDPRIVETSKEINANLGLDDAKVRQTLKGIFPYLIEQVFTIEILTQDLYTFWQPWVQNFHGEWSVGYYNLYNFPIWIWMDQDMKAEMTGRK